MKIITIVFMLLIASCMTAEEKRLIKDREIAQINRTRSLAEHYNYMIIIVDSCEYLRCPTTHNYWVLTHKGNCKFCEQRRRR